MKLGLNTISIWFGVIMIIVVMAGAIAFSVTDVMSDRLFGAKRIGLIVMLFVYSIYRSFRLYQSLKQVRHEK